MMTSGAVMARSATVHTLANKRTPQEFADIIRGKWQDNVPNILQVCMWLETARSELGKAGFMKLYRDELRWSKPMVSMLLKIAQNENVNDTELVYHGKLPGCWRTLYDLSGLTTEQFQHGLETGIIHAGMERKDIKELKPPKQKKTKVATVCEDDPVLEKWAAHVRSIVWNAMAKYDHEGWPRLFARLREEIDDLEQNEGQYHHSIEEQRSLQCG